VTSELFIPATGTSFPTYTPRKIVNLAGIVVFPVRAIPHIPATPGVCISEIIAVPLTELQRKSII
jgi:hypothetical protein